MVVFVVSRSSTYTVARSGDRNPNGAVRSALFLAVSTMANSGALFSPPSLTSSRSPAAAAAGLPASLVGAAEVGFA
jgi:hypothetical protein